MANDGFNGSTAAHGLVSLTPLVSISASSTGEIPVPSAADATKFFEAAIPTTTTTVEVLGGNPGVAVGTIAQLAIVWFDGGTFGSITSAVCTNVAPNGAMDSPITTTLTFMPAG
jgi:hypothetical protein